MTLGNAGEDHQTVPTLRRLAAFVFLTLASFGALLIARGPGGLAPLQIKSLTIFGALVWGIILYEDHRPLIAAGCVLAVLACRLLTFRAAAAAASIDVILFLLGTFLLAGYLEETRFFEHLSAQIVRQVGPRPFLLMAALMTAAAVASAIVGEVAAILFVGGALLHIAHRCKFIAAPFLIMLVFATNTGSAASPFGPIGVTIALKAHLSVAQFFRWGTPIAAVVLALTIGLCRLIFAPAWAAYAEAIRAHPRSAEPPDPTHGRSALPQWLLVAAFSALLVFHAPVERLVRLPENSLLVGTSVGAGLVALALSGRRAGQVLKRRVDWITLGFFLFLFVVVGALEASGVTSLAARAIVHATGGNPAKMVLLVGWSTGVTSSLFPNLLDIAAFIPVIAHLKSQGVVCPDSIYWLMLFGATLMGNLTNIGSTCNIIACGMARKSGDQTITFVGWLKVGAIVSVATMALATVLLAAQTHGLTK